MALMKMTTTERLARFEAARRRSVNRVGELLPWSLHASLGDSQWAPRTPSLNRRPPRDGRTAAERRRHRAAPGPTDQGLPAAPGSRSSAALSCAGGR